MRFRRPWWFSRARAGGFRGLRVRAPSCLVLSISELPQSQPIEVIAVIGGEATAPQPVRALTDQTNRSDTKDRTQRPVPPRPTSRNPKDLPHGCSRSFAAARAYRDDTADRIRRFLPWFAAWPGMFTVRASGHRS
jgi:hypothetical protein